MKKLILAILLIFGMASGSYAAVTQVSCLVTTTTIDARDAFRVLAAMQSEDTTNPVWICPAATCTVTTGWQLAPGTANSFNSVSWDFDQSRSAYSCISTGGTVVINYEEETR